MVVARTAQAVLFSLAVHGLIFGSAMLLTGHEQKASERVYRVSLADFAAPAVAQPVEPAQAKSQPEPVPPAPEPVMPRPEPEPTPKSEPVQPKVKNISASKEKKKEDKPAEKRATPKPVPSASAAPSATVAAAGAVARNVGGISVYESDRVDTRPGITKSAVPEFPPRARRMNVEGSVLVQVVVDREGMPQSPKILKATPEGYFEDAALRAVRRMRFTPGRLKGQPVNTLVNIPFAFKLR